MPAQFDGLLGHATNRHTLTDDELADLRQEITRDVVTELMFGPQRPDRHVRRAGKPIAPASTCAPCPAIC
ncbi:hypothetical protein N7U49_47720 (plasmid) [Streptomyces sp. AD2-2]|nr:hypothetical protein N7U49_47720 [Streptomyces sp. AD2-2]